MLITALLAGASLGHKRLAKKKRSPTLLIAISAAAGMVVYEIR